LYERIATMGEHFAKLGANLESAVGWYNKTVTSIESRVLVSARKMSELGAGSDKLLPETESIETRPRELPASLQSKEITPV
jgi:DNA recombination protein RmuC